MGLRALGDRRLNFKWLTLRPKEWAIRFTAAFSWPDAGREKCLAPGCGIERRKHGSEHRFVEKP